MLVVAVFICALVLCNLSTTRGHCYEELTAVSDVQVISSPSYPGHYGDYTRCTWVISSEEPAQQVEILFTQVRTEACCDYILVRDGDTILSPAIGNIRGVITSTRNFISTYGALYVTFESDDSITDTGFQIQYRRSNGDTGCGTNLTAETSIQFMWSPAWPANYPNNAYCAWNIMAVPGMEVQMRVLNLDVETCCDSLLIRDGTTNGSRVLAYLRGYVASNDDYTSSGGVLQVRFRSDQSENDVGFFAYYVSVPSNHLAVGHTHADEDELPLPILECGNQLLQTNPGRHGYFTSPGFPQSYPGDATCSWIIYSLPGKRIRIWFNYINTDICCDWIKVRDGPGPTSTKLGAISGNSGKFVNFVSSGNILRVEFDSDSYENKRGFSAFYESYTPGHDERTGLCGGVIKANESLQFISTPNWPGPYDDNALCVWNISTADSDMAVQLHVLGTITEREMDEIKIYNGETTSSPLLLTLSGKHYNRYIFTSEGQHMTVVFESNSSVSFGGFRASIQAIYKNLNGESLSNSDGKTLA